MQMEFVSIRDFRASSGQILRKVSQNEEVVVTNNGQPTAFLFHIPTGYFDEALQSLRQARVALESQMKANFCQTNTLTNQKECYFKAHPAEDRQASWKKIKTAFAQFDGDIDLDKERDERITSRL